MRDYIDVAFLLSVPLLVALMLWRDVSPRAILAPKTRAGRLLFGAAFIPVGVAGIHDILFAQEVRVLHPVMGVTLLTIGWSRTLFLAFGRHGQSTQSLEQEAVNR